VGEGEKRVSEGECSRMMSKGECEHDSGERSGWERGAIRRMIETLTPPFIYW
jgi:hypothetical protein